MCGDVCRVGMHDHMDTIYNIYQAHHILPDIPCISLTHIIDTPTSGETTMFFLHPVHVQWHSTEYTLCNC